MAATVRVIVPRAADRLAGLLGKHTRLFLSFFSLAYLVLMYRFAPQRPTWIDEFITFYIARLPVSEIWKVLHTGAESHPPSFLVLTHASMKLFGSGAFALRLPAILGFLLMEVCLFRFVARRTSALIALIALLIPFTTCGISYAMEARGYGLVLGFTALSLLCWQASAGSGDRTWAIAGLAASLAAATASHYFGAFVVLPLAVGELVRTAYLRRVDWPIWVAFLSPAVPLIAFLPVIRAFSSQATNHGLLNAKFDYFSFLLLNGHALVLVLLIAITAAMQFGNNRTIPVRRLSDVSFTRPEVAAILSYLVLPVGVFVLTKFAHLPFANRYVLSGVIGVSVLVCLAIDLLPARDVIAMGVLAGVVCWGSFSYIVRSGSQSHPGEPEDQFVLNHSKPGLPIVVSDINTFLTLSRSRSEAIASRIVYLADAEAAVHYLGSNTSDRLLMDIAHWLPARVAPYCGYVSGVREFEVYGAEQVNTNWLTYALTEDNVVAELAGVRAGHELFHIQTTGPSRLCKAAALMQPASRASRTEHR